MSCSKCGQELKEGARFCTKCGTHFMQKASLTVAVTSIILSAIGIIVEWTRSDSFSSSNGLTITVYFIYQSAGFLLICAGIIVALFSLYKQKNLIGLVAGLIPCAYLIIIEVYILFMKYFWR